MKNFVRVLCLALAIVMLCATLASCGAPAKDPADAVAALKAMKADGKVLCIVKDYDDNMLCSLANIPTVCLMKASSVNTYQMLWADKVLIGKDALDDLFQRIG